MYQLIGNDNKKKMLNMLILNILERYSDENHLLSQQDIIRYLKSDYGVDGIDRRTVRNNIKSLYEMGIDVPDPDPTESGENVKGYALYRRRFDDAELRMLIDAVLSSRTLSDREAKNLIQKLKNEGNIYFDLKVSHVKNLSMIPRTRNKNVLYAINDINIAIEKKRMIAFKYLKYDTDLKLHESEIEYVMSPYQMISSNGRYYLLGTRKDFKRVSYYRIDKMSKVRILDEKIKPLEEMDELGTDFDLPKHMAEHIYMFNGKSKEIKIRTTEKMLDTLVDWFGTDIRIKKCNDDEIIVTVKCNEKAIVFWALQYGKDVEIVSPDDVRSKIKETLEVMNHYYR